MDNWEPLSYTKKGTKRKVHENLCHLCIQQVYTLRACYVPGTDTASDRNKNGRHKEDSPGSFKTDGGGKATTEGRKAGFWALSLEARGLGKLHLRFSLDRDDSNSTRNRVSDLFWWESKLTSMWAPTWRKETKDEVKTLQLFHAYSSD